MSYAISVNADHLHKALTLVSKFRAKKQDIPCLQDIQMHIDNEGLWLTGTDRFRMLTSYHATVNKGWRDIPSDLDPYAISPEVVKDMTERLKEMGAKQRKISVVYFVVNENNEIEIGTPMWDDQEDLIIKEPVRGYLPSVVRLVMDAHNNAEPISRVWCGWLGSFKELDIISRTEGNKPQLLVNSDQGHSRMEHPPYRGLVMPIRLPQ